MKNLKLKTKKQKLPLKREFSAGGVVYRKFKNQNAKPKIMWLVGKHSGYKKWVLPKGLIEQGERAQETAMREVEEEMGVKAKLIDEKPIHEEQYFYWADFGKESKTVSEKTKLDGPEKRVVKYQESGGGKTKVFKIVKFFLMEYVGGETKDHSWEMSEAEWVEFQEAMKRLAFSGEKEALRQAQGKLVAAGLM